MANSDTINSLTTGELFARQEALLAHPEHDHRVTDEIRAIDAILLDRHPPVQKCPDEAEMDAMFAAYEHEQEIKGFMSDPDYQRSLQEAS